MGADTSAPPRDGSLAAVRDRYLHALIDADVASARAAIDDAVEAGADVRRIYLDVLQPTLHEVGRLWSHELRDRFPVAA
jgi:methanogenic corrinoid protein MtbC1